MLNIFHMVIKYNSWQFKRYKINSLRRLMVVELSCRLLWVDGPSVSVWSPRAPDPSLSIAL